MKYPMRVPTRYQSAFKHVYIEGEPRVQLATGVRPTLHHRWECRRCGKQIRPNTAAAQSHVAAHLRATGEEGAPKR